MPIVDGELLAAARSYNDITWEDPEGDAKLSGILQRGMARLNARAGVPLDYREGTTARELLLEYTRYVRADDLKNFELDYLPDLLNLHIDGEVAQYGESAQTPAVP